MKILRSAVYPIHSMGLIMICSRMAVQRRMGVLGVSVRQMKALGCDDGDTDTFW